MLERRGIGYDFYRTGEWKALRAAHLARQPACVRCGADRSLRSLVVDHVRPFGDDFDLARDPGNLQTLCRRCHGRKCAAEGWNKPALRSPQ
jgi:5-methylcytosine-specific restriction endonuclease McrA